METQSSMANVPREFPLTPSLPCCVWEQCCEPVFSHPDWKGAQGNRFPWQFTSIRQGTLEGPQPHLHSRGEKQELGLGLEKSMLLSLSITAFITLTNTLHQWRKHLLSCWKALAHQSRLPKHKHHFPELANLPFSLGFAHWQQLLQLWSREVAQALLCQQSSPRRERKAVSWLKAYTLICSHAQITSPMALPCFGFGNSSRAPSGVGQTVKIQCQVLSKTSQATSQIREASTVSHLPRQAGFHAS